MEEDANLLFAGQTRSAAVGLGSGSRTDSGSPSHHLTLANSWYYWNDYLFLSWEYRIKKMYADIKFPGYVTSSLLPWLSTAVGRSVYRGSCWTVRTIAIILWRTCNIIVWVIVAWVETLYYLYCGLEAVALELCRNDEARSLMGNLLRGFLSCCIACWVLRGAAGVLAHAAREALRAGLGWPAVSQPHQGLHLHDINENWVRSAVKPSIVLLALLGASLSHPDEPQSRYPAIDSSPTLPTTATPAPLVARASTTTADAMFVASLNNALKHNRAKKCDGLDQGKVFLERLHKFLGYWETDDHATGNKTERDTLVRLV
ncbi:hypothetical protein PG994_003343 [Apiospora phragmitis]|uniref:Uncharacterized protein n=1 Tax=Apiospora phragmitis TaxID=2905665 RepID=A0ABR1W0K0_9PEZI